jgi:hypothetical protein
MPHPRYASEEIARRGQTIYDQSIRNLVEHDNVGKYVVIDIESGKYEIGDDQLATAERILGTRPEAPLYLVRVGYPTAARIGKLELGGKAVMRGEIRIDMGRRNPLLV